MPRTTVQELLDAGVHFGHLRRKWNPAMAPYIFMEKEGIHIIDLQKTQVKLEEAATALKADRQIRPQGFVCCHQKTGQGHCFRTGKTGEHAVCY